VWEQLLVEASVRKSNVLLVTGDVKEDWWRRELGEWRGPRVELAQEMRRRTGHRLFMLRPASFLRHARTLLEVVVREESVAAADRIEKLLSERTDPLTDGGWEIDSLCMLLDELQSQAPVQETAIRAAAESGGFISREDVYELAGYSEDRSLRGFTRPITRIANSFKAEGLIPHDAAPILRTMYGKESPGSGWASGFAIDERVLGLFDELPSEADEA
jgi:hypothetical protein